MNGGDTGVGQTGRHAGWCCGVRGVCDTAWGITGELQETS